jgi:hypothetical protein
VEEPFPPGHCHPHRHSLTVRGNFTHRILGNQNDRDFLHGRSIDFWRSSSYRANSWLVALPVTWVLGPTARLPNSQPATNATFSTTTPRTPADTGVQKNAGHHTKSVQTSLRNCGRAAGRPHPLGFHFTLLASREAPVSTLHGSFRRWIRSVECSSGRHERNFARWRIPGCHRGP